MKGSSLLVIYRENSSVVSESLDPSQSMFGKLKSPRLNNSDLSWRYALAKNDSNSLKSIGLLKILKVDSH